MGPQPPTQQNELLFETQSRILGRPIFLKWTKLLLWSRAWSSNLGLFWITALSIKTSCQASNQQHTFETGWGTRREVKEFVFVSYLSIEHLIGHRRVLPLLGSSKADAGSGGLRHLTRSTLATASNHQRPRNLRFDQNWEIKDWKKWKKGEYQNLREKELPDNR